MTQNSNVLHLGQLMTGADLLLKKEALQSHMAILGMTGSGKSGLILGVTKELIDTQTPTILVDIKGDMINFALQKDLVDHQKMSVRCLTPGAMHGESINVFADLEDKRKIHTATTAILRMIGVDANPIKSKDHSYLATVLENRHAQQKPCTLLQIIHAVQSPGFHHLGALDLDEAYPQKNRNKLASKLNNLLVAPSFQAWREGIRLNLDQLLAPRADGKVPVIVYSVAHLVIPEEQNFAIRLLLDEILPWMKTKGGSNTLRLALVVDECVGLLPPHPSSPPTKTPLMTLLKQGRGFGVGVILATQNPVDLDYKGMSNCQTWVVGRLQMGKDKARIIQNVCSSSHISLTDMENKIGALQPRQFVLARPSGSVLFQTKDVSCEMRGPLTTQDVSNLYGSRLIERP